MKIHIVKTGDTLYALSQKYGVPLQTIIDANPQFSNPDVLAVGDKVKIPAATVPVPDNNSIYYKHTVKQGDSLWKLSKAWGVSLKEMIDANPQLKNPNALMTGEIVNVPKKPATSPTQPGYSPANAPDKTAVGGKTYTGPKEEMVAEAVKPVPKPEPKPEPKPAPVPVPVPVPAPLPAPVPELVSPAANMPNIQPEMAPMKETIHSEMQSLFVQISVPAQEAVSQYEMPKTEKKPSGCSDGVMSAYEHGGYPGLMQHPNFNDCPPAYPLYESASMMNNNMAPAYVQPMSYAPECMPPYYYSGNVSPMWYQNNAPAQVEGVSYEGMPVNLPWPDCGCGENMYTQSVQPYSYEMPMYNGYPVYMNPGMMAPYGMLMPNQGMMAPSMPVSAYDGSVAAGIPPYPQFPGMENMGLHTRVPEIQEPQLAEQLVTQPAQANTAEPVKAKNGTTKKTGAKARTSSLSSKAGSLGSQARRSNSTGSNGGTKKRKNPWTSN
ncbi:LysM peptidoglycan-binding domain-containing protein [Paenibacillus donghaensis]|uniref:LysM peptidoglycan-binding domain-containing protein n=1 Tax=Paenibacillus donghaensis TaxID=414771 RepID=UPI0012FD2EEB|nr:LysM peptidoglycan-binding domain-containing protein [Paenibacillus donghaensis]